MFNEHVREVLIRAGMEKEIESFSEYLDEYDKRFIKILKPQEMRPERLLGHNGLHYIQLALNRSKVLFDGTISAMNSYNGLLAILSARAHYEVTGALGYFYKKLTNFYAGVITYEQVDESLFRLTLGARIEELSKAPDPINVMTLIDATDDYFKNKIPEKVSMFRESYDFLSEFCHPNTYGITMGCEINKVGIVRYNKTLILTEKDLIFIHYLSMSITAFFRFYDMIYEILSSSEELPIMIK